MNNILSVSNLGKSYSAFQLKDISFSLPEGYIMGLIGPNGSGKTTIVQLLLNMLQRDSGEITIFGKDSIRHETQVKQEIGVVFDSLCFVEDWRVSLVETMVSGFYPRWDSARYHSLLEQFGISLNMKIKELSRGTQMKLMLAYALSFEARLLLLDEPTSGLDPLARSELLDILQEYVENGQRSVLFSTHITTDLERVADYLTYIRSGDLVYSGRLDAFRESWRIVRGDINALAGFPEQKILGLRRSGGAFEGLIAAEDSAVFNGCILDMASLDEIMIFCGRS